ncbi:zinc transport system permease protein [Succinivibrio dextrinosolvens DSM 3072]|uniref:Zinc transport system permease protein n=1 Tax=Succinivibrio dextrinosolvens DSM 3072 TaxID=1123324 RepID=A0A1T4VIY5_9GAMM|nr:metal ABC transporter permease [Succinivibrio dextrinosolvens]SKA64909.1 zinc transport system permease protein [Succinivibrio dextrinosolvens DSM 3072]
MIDSIIQMFSYSFMVRAFITGLFISACASIIGVSLVLKHYSMMGDGLSHVGFGTLALAVVLNQSPLYLSLPVVMLCAFLLLSLSKRSKVQADAAIALISTSALALGVMLLSVTTGMNTDVCNYLFGSILGMKVSDMYVTIFLCSVIIVLYILFYPKIFAITFDETFAKASGLKVKYYNLALALMSAVIITLGMRMMGALLISNLIVIPALTAMRVCRSFKNVVLYSLAISLLCFAAGLYVSYEFSTPTGASIVLINVALFLVHVVIEKIRGSNAV